MKLFSTSSPAKILWLPLWVINAEVDNFLWTEGVYDTLFHWYKSGNFGQSFSNMMIQVLAVFSIWSQNEHACHLLWIMESNLQTSISFNLMVLEEARQPWYQKVASERENEKDSNMVFCFAIRVGEDSEGMNRIFLQHYKKLWFSFLVKQSTRITTCNINWCPPPPPLGWTL